MARRYNPPPSWPAPPRGWTPTEDWTPPSDFPPLPEGWELWVDDDAPAPDPDAPPSPAVEAAHAAENKRRLDKQTWTLLIIGGALALYFIGDGVIGMLRG